MSSQILPLHYFVQCQTFFDRSVVSRQETLVLHTFLKKNKTKQSQEHFRRTLQIQHSIIKLVYLLVPIIQ